ncbi:MAG: hypothetical protein AB1716_09745 [Planctomycetota bacterium]
MSTAHKTAVPRAIEHVVRAIALAALAILFSLELTEVLLWLLDSSPVTWVLLQLTWLMTPWRDLPNVLSQEYVLRASMLNEPIVGTSDGPGLLFALTVWFILALILFELAIYLSVAGLYRVSGWPSYAREVNWHGILWPGFAQFAWRALWVMPAVRLIAGTCSKVGWIFAYAGYPVLAGYGSLEYGLLTPIAMAVLYAWVSGRALRRRISAAITVEQRHCERCDYLLTGLTEPRCPECGTRFSLSEPPRLRLGQPGRLRWRLARASTVMVLAISLAAPLWVTLSLKMVPTSALWTTGVSSSVLSNLLAGEWRWRQWRRSRFPLKGNYVWVVRGEGAQAVIRIAPEGRACSLQWAYWPDAALAQSEPPAQTQRTSVFAQNVTGQHIQVGPWTFGVSLGFDDVIFLEQPPGLTVEIVPAADSPWPMPESAPASAALPRR